MAGSDILKRLTIILSVNDAATAQLSTVSSSLRSFAGVTGQATNQMAKMGRRFAQVGRALVSFLIIRTIGVQFGRFFALMFEGNQVLEKATTSLERLGGSLAYARKQIEFIRQTAMRAPFDFQSILQASRLLVAYGKDLQTYLPILLDWAAALGATSGQLEGYAAAMGKIMAGSPYVLRILTTRAVGLDQWKSALEQTNTALPKSERFAQALTIALERFEGQARVLAGTMAGLRTNIRDVWVEITREVGLAMFARVRAALFEIYDGMRNIADNQRDVLYEIGDIFGQWSARLIEIIGRAGKMKGVFDKILAVAKHLAVFIIGRSLVMAFVRVGLQIQVAVIALMAMSTIATTVHIAIGALSIVAGLIAVEFMKAKMAAIDFHIAVGDLGAAMTVIEDFMDSEEKVFTREQLAVLRNYEQGVRRVNASLYATTAIVDRWADDSTKLVITLQDWKNLFVDLRKGVPWDKEMFHKLLAFSHETEAVMERALGDDAWAERVRAALDAITAIERAVGEGIKPDAGVYRAEILKLMTALGEITPVFDAWREGSVKLVEENDRLAATYDTQEVALRAMNLIMQDYEAHQLGIAAAADATTEATIRRLREEAKGLVDPALDMAGWVTLYSNIAKVQGDIKKNENDIVKALAEGFDKRVAEWEYTLRIAELQSRLNDDVTIYASALATVIAEMQALEKMPMFFTKDEWDQLTERILQGRVDLQELVATAEEAPVAFTLWQQALNPIVSAFGSIVDGSKEMAKAFGNAMKAMLKWAIQLAAQLLILTILMSIFKLVSGGMTGLPGALSALLGGGIGSAPSDFIGPMPGRAMWSRGPELAFAGGDITPRLQTHSGGGDTHIHMENAVVLDGESFVRMIDDANYKLERRKGGGI